MENFSRKISQTLDHLGYNHDMIQFRRNSWRHFATKINYYAPDGNCICITQHWNPIAAGSKAEGVTSLFESDIDLMLLPHDIICINNTDELPSHQLLPYRTVRLLADMENVPPGYTRLKLYSLISLRNDIHVDSLLRKHLLETPSGEFCLPNMCCTVYREYIKSAFAERNLYDTISHDISGPAQSFSQCVDFDIVIGLSCYCPQLLQTWDSRRRHHEWPSTDTIRTACSFLPQVVPVGAKGSDRQDQEWRFCFIESELALTDSLNGTQIKLLIILKMVAKEILKEVTDEISSYIMKNITYWLSELLPLHVFREEKLVWLVLVGLATLRSAITDWQNLPYYMIPSRNLLSERLDASTQSKLSNLLWMLIREGPLLFLRLGKLSKCLKASEHIPRTVVKLANSRNQFEIMVLKLMSS